MLSFGNDAIRFFALLIFPLFALNGVGRRADPPPAALRVLGASSFLFILFCTTELCMRKWRFSKHGGPGKGRYTLIAFGLADLAPMSTGLAAE